MIKGRTGPYATSSSGTAPGKLSTTRRPRDGERNLPWAVCNRTFAGLLLRLPMYGLKPCHQLDAGLSREADIAFQPMQAGFLYGLPSIAALALIARGRSRTDASCAADLPPGRRGLVPTLAICWRAMVALLPVAAAEHRWAAVGVLMAGYGFGTLGFR